MTNVIAALGFMFGCFRMKPAAATILTLSIFFIDVVLTNLPYFRELRHLFVSWHMGLWVRTFHEHPPWPSILGSAAYLLGLSITFATIGIAHFAGRDLKG